MNEKLESPRPQFDTDTIKYLVGGLGLQVLNMIHHGCITKDDIVRFSSISPTCLDIKIELLLTLNLISKHGLNYSLTREGYSLLQELSGGDL